MTATWDDLHAAAAAEPVHLGNVAKRFVMPPFSVLDTMAAEWQARKRQWLALGIQSELGRGMAASVGAIPMTGSAGEMNRAMADARAIKNVDLMRGEGAGRYEYAPGKARAFEGGGGDLMRQPNDYAYGAQARAVQEATAGLWDDETRGPSDVEAYGVSVFDPVLCELVYRWWSPPAGAVLDPFAGGSVRGIVAARMGHDYYGIDLSEAQVDANVSQAETILEEGDAAVQWWVGDSATVLSDPANLTGPYDLVFTCPPYYDLERYSDDPADLSAKPTYAQFLDAYRAILAGAARRLADGRFMVVVVSEVRDKNGAYIGLVPDTIRAVTDAGLRYYNEAILVNSVGSLALRITKQFEAGRKLGRRHQNVLVFLKGATPRGWSYDREAPPDPQLTLLPDVEVPLLDATPDETAAALEMLAAVEAAVLPLAAADDAPEVEFTPVQRHGDYWLKRDDLYAYAGIRGGKVRTCVAIATEGDAPSALVTAGSRHSPQVSIVARVGEALGLPVRCHVPAGEPGPELDDAVAHGATLVQHRPGYNSVIVARAREDAAETGARLVPFGMDHAAAVRLTSDQVANLPDDIAGIVVPVGSGMTLAGILDGLDLLDLHLPVVGVVVGADPTDRLDRWAPADWRDRVNLVVSPLRYDTPAPVTRLGDVDLDPYYEAKCLPYLQPGWLLWCVGRRATGDVPAVDGPGPAVTPGVGTDTTAPTVEAPVAAAAAGTASWPLVDPLGRSADAVAPDDVASDVVVTDTTSTLPPDYIAMAQGELLLPAVDYSNAVRRGGKWWDSETGELLDSGGLDDDDVAESQPPWREGWRPYDPVDNPDPVCWTCGAQPSHRFMDGSPSYSCVHPATVRADQ